MQGRLKSLYENAATLPRSGFMRTREPENTDNTKDQHGYTDVIADTLKWNFTDCQ